ncbi:16896_t:CDS:2, partial [Cetraspora pellucida]
MTVGSCIAVIVSLIALVLVVFSFSLVNPEIPEQSRHRFTGYLTWLPELDGFDANELDATLLFNQIILLLASYYAIKWTYNPPTSPRLITRFSYVGENDTSVTTHYFDSILAFYNVMTLLAGVAIFLFGVGKIWVAVGVLHNAAEFTLLVILGSGGRIKSPVFWPILGFYISLVTVCSILFKFPYDALWFKGQGLCFDWALIIEFTRVYVTTLRVLKNGDGTDLINTTDHDHDETDVNVHHDHKNSFHPIINHPHQLLLLIVGAVFHVVGNIVFTLYKYSFNA